jgi:hypothetical protein
MVLWKTGFSAILIHFLESSKCAYLSCVRVRWDWLSTGYPQAFHRLSTFCLLRVRVCFLCVGMNRNPSSPPSVKSRVLWCIVGFLGGGCVGDFFPLSEALPTLLPVLLGVCVWSLQFR